MDYMKVRYCSENMLLLVPGGGGTSERSAMGYDEPNRTLPKGKTPMHLKSCPHGRFQPVMYHGHWSQAESLILRRESSHQPLVAGDSGHSPRGSH